MRNGILATIITLWAGVGVFAQGYTPMASREVGSAKPIQPCACQSQPRVFPGLFGWFDRYPTTTRVEAPLVSNPQPFTGNVAQVKQTPPMASPKVLPAYLPPALPPRLAPAATVAAPEPVPVARVNFNNLLEQSGHDRNYSWITGVLKQKVGVPNVWFIHYLPPDALPDLHGGALPIQTRASFENLRDGDLVTVIGYVITNADVANQRMTAFAADQVNKIQK